MAQPSVSQVQAVDPVLTNMLIGYQQADSRFVADKVFPGVAVDKDSGTYFILTKKYWFLNEMKTRAPGTPFPLSGYGVETATYTTLQWALAHAIADEVRANSQVPMDLERIGAQWLAQQMLLRKEISWATDFMAVSVWTTQDNNSATDWDDFSAGDPVANILTGLRTVSNLTGYTPNSLVLGAIVHEALVNHPDIIDRVKYTQAATMATMEAAVAAALGVQNYWVARGSYNSANEGQTATYAAIIDDDALLCYVDPNPGILGATAGKTFHWAPGGGLGSILPVYRDEMSKADVLRSQMQWDQVVTAADLGAIWLDIV